MSSSPVSAYSPPTSPSPTRIPKPKGNRLTKSSAPSGNRGKSPEGRRTSLQVNAPSPSMCCRYGGHLTSLVYAYADNVIFPLFHSPTQCTQRQQQTPLPGFSPGWNNKAAHHTHYQHFPFSWIRDEQSLSVRVRIHHIFSTILLLSTRPKCHIHQRQRFPALKPNTPTRLSWSFPSFLLDSGRTIHARLDLHNLSCHNVLAPKYTSSRFSVRFQSHSTTRADRSPKGQRKYATSPGKGEGGQYGNDRIGLE